MTIPRDDLIHAGEWLHEYYKSEEGLQRPEGLWIDGQFRGSSLCPKIPDKHLTSPYRPLGFEQFDAGPRGGHSQHQIRRRHPTYEQESS